MSSSAATTSLTSRSYRAAAHSRLDVLTDISSIVEIRRTSARAALGDGVLGTECGTWAISDATGIPTLAKACWSTPTIPVGPWYRGAERPNRNARPGSALETRTGVARV